jgi:HK97 gp10 family phage protein
MPQGRIDPKVLAAVSRSPAVKRQTRLVADVIKKGARRRAPKVSGNLQKNIDIEEAEDPKTGVTEYHVGWRKAAWYGAMVELGTEDTPAQPHLRPAADELRN